jgi:putative ABC transport system permease protein
VEIGLYSLLSLVLTGLVIILVVPTFNSIFGSALSVEYFLRAGVLAQVAAILFISSLILVGIISHKQWQMKPVELVNNKLAKIRFNQGLFTLQFAVSTILATCSITIVKQINHIETAPLGFSRNLIQLGAPGFQFSDRFPALKHRVLQLPDVNGVTITGGNPISANSIVRLELEDGSSYSPYLFVGDEDLVNTMQLELIEGTVPSPQNEGNLVNETMVRTFDLTHPIGKTTPGTEGKIVGIVRDFTIGSFREPVPPVIISSYKEEGKALLINYSGDDLKGLLAQLRSEWERVFPNDNFDYRIIQEDLLETHKEDIFLFRVVTLFSVVSIILSCFGLFALSWAMTQNRRREIGIRKVLGATTTDVLHLVTISFAKRIALAFAIAVPVGYYLMDKWLAGFITRINLGAEIFIMSAIIMTIISAVTLSLQTLQAVFTNPVQEIRKDGE